MVTDRAYSGLTGNKAELELATKLGIKGVSRIGLADKMHCYSSAAEDAWNAYKPACKDPDKKSSSRGSSGSKTHSLPRSWQVPIPNLAGIGTGDPFARGEAHRRKRRRTKKNKEEADNKRDLSQRHSLAAH